jgi:threonine dehydrogenase-like Zn-dependent dehydrogenase
MTEMMWQVAKDEGVGNVVLQRVPVPEPGPDEVLVRTRVSLISRGSELIGRYERPEVVAAERMGYSTTGTVVRTGARVTAVAPGDRVVCVAPHAEFAVKPMTDTGRGRFRIWPLDPAVSFEAGTFHQLAASAACWTYSERITEQDTVVVLGQGIVGSLVMQFARRYRPAQLIAVDALELRCRLAAAAGAPLVINAADEDPVAAVRRLTGGKGATIVANCVSGGWCARAFEQAQDMLAPGGLLHEIGHAGGNALPFYPQRMMGQRLLGGYPPDVDRDAMAGQAMAALAAGEVQVEPLITHRFPGQEAKQAFDLLYEHPDQALGVLLEWA